RHAGFGSGKTYLAQNLARFQRSGEQVNKKFAGLDYPLAFRAGHNDVCIQRDDRCGSVSRWIGMSETAADGPLVAYLYIAQMLSSFREQGTDAAQQLGRFNLIMRCHRADAHLALLFANVG